MAKRSEREALVDLYHRDNKMPLGLYFALSRYMWNVAFEGVGSRFDSWAFRGWHWAFRGWHELLNLLYCIRDTWSQERTSGYSCGYSSARAQFVFTVLCRIQVLRGTACVPSASTNLHLHRRRQRKKERANRLWMCLRVSSAMRVHQR